MENQTISLPSRMVNSDETQDFRKKVNLTILFLIFFTRIWQRHSVGTLVFLKQSSYSKSSLLEAHIRENESSHFLSHNTDHETKEK